MIGVITALISCGNAGNYEPRNGDIIFQTSRSAQSVAIQKATGSKYSHMGIVYVRDGKPVVFEAVEPVKMTPLQTWIDRGVDKKYVVKRLKNADELLNSEALNRMLQIGKTFQGKHYDLVFGWSDERIYCSELVWKIYKRALDLEIGKLQQMKEFDLSDPVVKAKLKERYGENLPLDEWVISPGTMFESKLLTTVYSN